MARSAFVSVLMIRMRERVPDKVASVCDRKEYGIGMLQSKGSFSGLKIMGSTESGWYTSVVAEI